MFTDPCKATACALIACLPLFVSAQATSPGTPSSEQYTNKNAEGAQAPAKSGQEITSPHPVQLDAQHRPITAGGFVKSGPVVFEDASEKSGLAKWTHKMGTPVKDYIVETKGSGVGLIDYDNDGWLDIYLVNGSTFNALDGKETPPHAALYHNNHDGTFTDVTDKAGVGLDDPVAWHTGATWGDFDGDGKLDLFVAGYLHYDRKRMPTAGDADAPNAFCTFRGEKVSCGPRGLKGEGDHLFHNNGDGTFTDVSEKAGVADKPGYYGLGAVFADINNDGKPDLLVGNDSTPNYLYLNKGDGTFEDVSYASGFALNEAGRETASMGIAVGDYQNNGMLDIFDTTFSDDYKPLYKNEGDANLTDISYQLGIAEISVPFLSWGDAFMDYDNDGWKDLLMSDGHVYPEADKYAWGTSWKQRPMLFHNIEGKRFEAVPAVEGTGLAVVIAGRGLAAGDLFNDGKLDAVINVMDGHPVLLRNVSPDKNHWLELKLVGGGKADKSQGSPRDAVGSTVYVTANGMKQRQDVISGGSYLSSNDLRPHFGLGQAISVDAIEVHWPSGKVEKFTVPAVDRIVT